MPLSFFFQFPCFSAFPLLLREPPHSATMFSYVCMDLLTVHMCDLCCFRYIFHVLPVFIYIKAFPLCFHCVIFDHVLVCFTCLFLFEFPYTHSWLKLLTLSFCCIKLHVCYILAQGCAAFWLCFPTSYLNRHVGAPTG